MASISPSSSLATSTSTTDELVECKERIAFLEAMLPTREMLEDEFSTLRCKPTFLRSLQKDILDSCSPSGIWKGKISGSRGAYPNVLRRCKIGNIDFANGKRKSNAVMFTCSHVILVANGMLPYNYGVHASHLCHNTRCLKIEHLRWELRYINEKRNRCIGQTECLCGQSPPCIPNAHSPSSM